MCWWLGASVYTPFCLLPLLQDMVLAAHSPDPQWSGPAQRSLPAQQPLLLWLEGPGHVGPVVSGGGTAVAPSLSLASIRATQRRQTSYPPLIQVPSTSQSAGCHPLGDHHPLWVGYRPMGRGDAWLNMLIRQLWWEGSLAEIRESPVAEVVQGRDGWPL